MQEGEGEREAEGEGKLPSCDSPSYIVPSFIARGRAICMETERGGVIYNESEIGDAYLPRSGALHDENTPSPPVLQCLCGWRPCMQQYEECDGLACKVCTCMKS